MLETEEVVKEADLTKLRINLTYLDSIKNIAEVDDEFLRNMLRDIDEIGKALMTSKEASELAQKITDKVLKEQKRRRTLRREKYGKKNLRGKPIDGPHWYN